VLFQIYIACLFSFVDQLGTRSCDFTQVDATFKLPLEWLAVLCLAAQVLVCHTDLVSERHAFARAIAAAFDSEKALDETESEDAVHASGHTAPLPYAPPVRSESGHRPPLPPLDRTVSVFSEGARTHRTSTPYSERNERGDESSFSNGGGLVWEGPSWAHPSTWAPSREQLMASRRENRTYTTITAPRDDVPARKVLPSDSSADESSIISDLTMSETGRDSPERPDPSASPPESPQMNSAEALAAHHERQRRRGRNGGGGSSNSFYANSSPNHRRGGAPRFFAQGSSPRAGLQRAVSFEESVGATLSYDLRGASAIRENSLIGGESIAATESVALTTSGTDISGDFSGGGDRQQQRQQQWTPGTPDNATRRDDQWPDSPLQRGSTPPRGDGALKFGPLVAGPSEEGTPSRQPSAAQRSMSNGSFLPAYPTATDASIADSDAPSLPSRFEPSSSGNLDGVFE